MSNYIEYENGQSKYGEFEVVRASTADLFFGNVGNAASVDKDYAKMLGRVFAGTKFANEQEAVAVSQRLFS